MSDRSESTITGKIFLLLFLVALGAGGYLLTQRRAGTDEAAPAGQQVPAEEVTVNFAYGTEKERWIQWVVQEFRNHPKGRNIRIQTQGIGSLDGVREVIKGARQSQLFSPGSSVVRDILVSEWQLAHGNQPILREESLALTPMVFIGWRERLAAFSGKFPKLTFDSVSQALAEPTGWAGLAGKPEWGFFKFGCPDPANSNGGLVTLALMAHTYHNKTKPLLNADVVDAGFQAWFSKTSGALGGLAGSSGSMMRDMVLRGPSAYDVIFAYENVAIDYLSQAAGRWGELQLGYPALNMWNDNPCYLLDAKWSSPAQRQAAGDFLDFLMSPPAQQQALVHGFRPGNPEVPVQGAQSPFTKYASHGLRVEVPIVCPPPQGEALLNLQTAWQRNRQR